MFARAYDLLMQDVDYGALYERIQTHLHIDDHIIDAGCGTGYMLLELVTRGHHAIGIDLDPTMLSIASEKLREKGVYAPLYEHDLRKPIYAKADVILALFDVLNYMKGILDVFRHFKSALNPKGRIIFDIYREDVLLDYDGYVEEEDEPFHYVWRIDCDGSRMNHRVTIGEETDVIRQYVYPLSYYLGALEALGFTWSILESMDPRKHLVVATLASSNHQTMAG